MAKRKFDGAAPTEFSAPEVSTFVAEKPQATKELTVVPEPPKAEVISVVEAQPEPLVQEHVRAHFEFHREALLAGLARKRGLGTLRD